MNSILIVEDETIVARDISNQLKQLGYEPAADTTTGEEALVLAERLHPDLVLMDIQLAGAMDGIVAAQAIRERFDIPVVFLTAFAGDAILERAALTEPFGYLVKPFEKRDLQIVLSMAFHKQRMDKEMRAANQQLRINEERFKQLARHSRTGIWEVDAQGVYTYCSQVFTELAGYPAEEIVGKKHFYNLHPEAGREAFKTAAFEVFARKESFRDLENPIQTRDGRTMWVSTNGIPVLDLGGKLLGYKGSDTDITQRQQAEEQLREREQEFRTLTEAMPQIVWITRPDGWNIYFNQQWVDYTGLTLEESYGHGWSIPFHPDDRKRAWDAWQRATTKCDPYALECRLRRADGAYRWWLIRSVPLRDANGGILKWFGTCTDIDDLKQVETALRESEATLNEAQRVAHIGSWHLDCVADVIWWSDELYRIYEKDPASPPSNYEEDQHNYTPESAARLTALVKKAVQTGEPYEIDLERASKSGPNRWVVARGEAVRNAGGQIVELRGTVQDITERKGAEAKLREQAALLEIARDAIVVYDLDGRIRFMNHAAEALTGWSLAEAKTRDLKEIMVFKPAGAQESAQAETLRQGAWTGELTLLNGEKKEIQIESRWTLVRDEAGHPKSILMVNTDITRAKELKAQYLRAQRLESIGTLASGIAHDLNNVLSPILMGLTVIKTELKNEENLAMVAMIEKSARRGADTVKQLLTFARGAGAQKGLVQPRHLLKEVGQLLNRTFPKSIQIYTDYPARPWAILANPSQIHQVLMNLSVNARDAMPSGGVLFLKLRNQVLGEDAPAPHLLAKPGPYVVFEVSDSGQGMPPEVVERIFEPFFSTKPEGQGTGLGLSTVIGIVEEHGGFVLVDTQVGRGTTFSAYLPAEPDRDEIPGEGFRLENPAMREEGILLVDDEPSIVDVAHRFLIQQGYKVQTAKNASEALDWFKAHRPEIQIVITDVMMPFVDGRQLVQSLRELDPHLPILVMSGVLTPSLQAEIQAKGASGFLAKPFAADTLLAKLRELLPGKPV